MQRQYVSSNNVCSIGYSDGVIEVEFNNGTIYQYYGTSQSLFSMFLAASSKGQFVHQYLKGYNYSRIN